VCSFKIKSLCELIDSDAENSGRLEICVEDAEMKIKESCPEFVFTKKPKPSEVLSPQPQDYKVSEFILMYQQRSLAHFQAKMFHKQKFRLCVLLYEHEVVF
jgi:hypothetical protein